MAVSRRAGYSRSKIGSASTESPTPAGMASMEMSRKLVVTTLLTSSWFFRTTATDTAGIRLTDTAGRKAAGRLKRVLLKEYCP